MSSATHAPEAATIRPGEAARRIGVQASTLRKWIQDGVVEPTARTAGGESRFSEHDLQHIIELHRSHGVMTRAPQSVEAHEPEAAEQERAHTSHSVKLLRIVQRVVSIVLAAWVIGMIIMMFWQRLSSDLYPSRTASMPALVKYAARHGYDRVVLTPDSSPAFYRGGQQHDERIDVPFSVNRRPVFDPVSESDMIALTDAHGTSCRAYAGTLACVESVNDGLVVEIDPGRSR